MPEPMPEPVQPEVTLSPTGSYASSSGIVRSIVNGVPMNVFQQSIEISSFGYWARVGDDTLFRANLNASWTLTNGVPSQSYNSSVTGTPIGTNPISGSAVWTGGVRGVTQDLSRVTGESSLEFDFSDSTIDVGFTGFDNGQADMFWDSLDVTNGVFQDGTALEGEFFGDAHEGVAGKFSRENLNGVFGAVRE